MEDPEERRNHLAMLIEEAVAQAHRDSGVTNGEILEVIGSMFISTAILGGNSKDDFLIACAAQYDGLKEALIKGGATMGTPLDEEKAVH